MFSSPPTMSAGPTDHHAEVFPQESYCAICGAAFRKPYLMIDQGEYRTSENYYFPGSDWLQTALLIGESPSAPKIQKVYISGEAGFVQDGLFEIYQAGFHPNDPTFTLPDMLEGAHPVFPAYDFKCATGFVLPIHKACVGILERVSGLKLGDEENLSHLQALYNLFRSFADGRGESGSRLPRMNYCGIPEQRMDHWFLSRDTIAFASNPLECSPRLEEYLLHLTLQRPQKRVASNKSQAPEIYCVQSSDPFAKLPPELVFMVLLHLPMISIERLRYVSFSVARVELGDRFWQRKVRIDMPWLFEMPDTLLGGSRDDLDWANIYAQVAKTSQLNYKDSIGCVVNRRRIWNICEWISMMSKRWMKASHQTRSLQEYTSRPGFLGYSNVIASPLQRLRWPSPAHVDTFILHFDHELGLADHSARIFSAYWSSDGVLSGLGISPMQQDQAHQRQSIGHRYRVARRDDVNIGADDCIVGFVAIMRCLNGSFELDNTEIVGLDVLLLNETIHIGEAEGYKKRLGVDKNSVLIGLQAQLSFDGRISALCLLQSQAAPDCCQKIRRRCQRQTIDPKIQSKLWKELPPDGIQLRCEQFCADEYTGGPTRLPTDLWPMEQLLFGYDDEELSSIVEIACDTNLGAFEIRYSNREPRSIGPHPTNMKSLPIDGHGGERIICFDFEFDLHGGVQSIGFLTNRDRRLEIRQGPYWLFYSENMQASRQSEILCGIYATWGSGRAQPDGIGLMFKDGDNSFAESVVEENSNSTMRSEREFDDQHGSI
ncbi:hypothetical protein N7492_009408 [Penicillium capsulatum]|uniref:F-box domain-containing protein n=1 Tax=Penicillium capsulatum TaxID=69766 RepID=A0A9W9HUK6_9EURO|nr:hypothetical protein N7492_009408 [Penicillium capsulatum]KAJ6106801.1 hypothetical protein N7512_010318 [Penicillium capsulatum]